MNWQLQEAKNKLSKLVETARNLGPQVITVRGKEAVVVLSIEEYRKLTKHEDTLLDFFQSSPLHGIELDLTRDRHTGRDVDL
jgi:prevent-host-death family protein